MPCNGAGFPSRYTRQTPMDLIELSNDAQLGRLYMTLNTLTFSTKNRTQYGRRGQRAGVRRLTACLSAERARPWHRVLQGLLVNVSAAGHARPWRRERDSVLHVVAAWA